MGPVAGKRLDAGREPEAARSPGTPEGPPATGGTRSRGTRLVPWLVIALWLAALALTGPFAGKLGDVVRDEAVDYLPGNAESTRVQELVRKLPGGDTIDVILVHHRDGGLTGGDRTAARAQITEIAQTYDLRGGQRPRSLPSEDGSTLMTPVSLTGIESETAQTQAVRDIRENLDGAPDGLSVEVGGAGALQTDMEDVYNSIDGTLMIGTAAVVAVLLILTYRSPVLWLVPLLVVGCATSVAMAAVYGLVAQFDLTVTSMSESVMTVLIFGAGTDYALLLVARYREELRRRERPYEAMLVAIRGCGPAILASSGTVALGLMCLLAADLNSSSGLGPVGAVGVVCALVAMTTLLPAVLVLLGRRVFWPLIPRYGTEPPTRRSLFTAMGSSAERRPVTILVTGALLLGALAVGAFQLPGNLKQEDGFTDKPESVSAMQTLADAYPQASTLPITVLTHTEQARQVTARVRQTDGVARVVPGRSGDGWTALNVFAADPPESAGETATIKRLRDAVDEVRGAGALVGGPSAQQIDLADTNARDRKVVIPLVLAVVLLVLITLLRSLTAPLILVVAVVASWGAAMGVGGLVFEPLLGFEGLDASLPLLTFVFLVALGVDYGIFLVHRMREEALGGALVPEAALTALRTTGGVITSAGIVLAATFLVLATMPMVAMVEMGLVIAVGVLLDTFLVRTYLVTSASVLLKRWLWWPGALFRRDGRTARGAGTERP